MKEEVLEENVYKNAKLLLKEKGYVSPLEILIKMGRIKQKEVEDWRFKKIPYLERAVSGNLRKLNHVLRALKKFAIEENLKPSKTVYKSWGKGPEKTLRFTKTGNPNLEKLYSTHYVPRRK